MMKNAANEIYADGREIAKVTKETKILILEDIPTDAELAVRELRRAGLQFVYKRIDTKEGFENELAAFEPDLILSDYSLPQFNGLDALRLLKQKGYSIPFILCTGSLSEELAVECMKEGAWDYILKTSLKRLPSAIVNALDTHKSRTEKEKALNALRRSEAEFRSIVETTHEWIWATNIEGRLTYSNPAVEEILGYKPETIIGKYALDFIIPDERQLAVEFFNDSISKNEGWTRAEFPILNKNGEIRYLESNAVVFRNGDGSILGFRGSSRDVTEQKRAEEKLFHDAFHDSLTGLANRSLFMEHLRLATDRGRNRRGSDFAVLYLDIDRFKVINDSLGHTEGDNLLRDISRRLETCVRPGDLVARLGGDEFVVLLSELNDYSDATRVAERILNDLKRSFTLAQRPIHITTSIGIALSSSDRTSAEDMIRDADIAMYCAKSAGRAQFKIFDDAMHLDASRKLSVETEMRLAFERREFVLHYQPIIDLEKSQLSGFEALIRWQHPERGMIAPQEFIPIAEESGLIIKLGEWTVTESCRQMTEWQQQMPSAAGLKMSVNLSSMEFRQPDLADKVVRALEKSGLPPECLKLEITESHIMENSELAITIINRLRKVGIEFSLDDFGTGYSCLSYLHRLPFSYLKVDRSFVSLMTESTENYEIVETIIKLGRSLKMKVIAEGIEDASQLGHLKNFNCDFGQGFFLSRPLDAAAAGRFISEKYASNGGRHG